MNWKNLCDLDDLVKILLVDQFQLVRKFKNRVLVFENFFKLYLEFFYPASQVQIVPCTRYSLDKKQGVTVIAKKGLEAGTILHCVFGLYKTISPDEEKSLDNLGLNFSILTTSSSSNSKVLLGSIAFINHDCDPNAEYISKSRERVSLRILIIASHYYFVSTH
ncbi:hypothetical protein TSAR_016249 [Trichomalopsis sarcophagae]|uniref:SET domain-containing protein n=1 Tax=Trichomalopsis sarcophagae TaxID=543379 RepID=A0A232ET86_9HYME|nr:hypothetical protein TSAR_016249 [Trichomalopsis sarcophagae]